MNQLAMISRFSGALFSVGLWLLTVLMVPGCQKAAPQGKPIDVRPKVQLVKPTKRTIKRSPGQPGYVYAYEQTSIFPKVSGYIQKWNVDIGDWIKKDQVIVEIYVPELVAELKQKQAQIVQSKARLQVAEQMVNVARHNYAAAQARVQEAQANVAKYNASVERWKSEVERLTSVSSDRVIDPQILAESKKQLQSDIASREAAQATAIAAEADAKARQADIDKAKVDVETARANVEVNIADEQRVAALVGYTRILAPYDGIVVARNANTGDYVQPGSGDLSSPGNQPIYVVARTDKVRIYVDVPEMEANYVAPGSKAKISFPAREGEEIDATVTRTSWSLNLRSRTLRAEIDLPNPQARLLPGTYVYGSILIERPNVLAVPLGCVIEKGNQNICFVYDEGKAVLTPVQTGINDGKWIEVTRKQENGDWTQFTGTEQVIQGDLTELANGQEVEAVKASTEEKQ